MKFKLKALAAASALVLSSQIFAAGGTGGIEGIIHAPIIKADATKPAGDMSRGADNFYKSTSLNGYTVEFRNIYGLKVVGNLFIPKSLDVDSGARLPAIVVGHPMGAVKEQSGTLYAQKMAEKGYVTLAIDLNFWGESGGEKRNAVAPELYAEDFSAAVDYLGTRNFVDRDRIGLIGICGSGSFGLAAAKIDSRIKAVATVSMYNMGNANRHGLKHSITLKQRKELIRQASDARYAEFLGGESVLIGGTTNKLEKDTDPIQREFYDFYRTKRGFFAPAGMPGDNTTHPTLTTNVKFMNFYPFEDLDEISPRPVLFITGENAHSREFS
ncbi:MAG: alpha/beta hydrolase, partial [Succinivibrio sp.]